MFPSSGSSKKSMQRKLLKYRNMLTVGGIEVPVDIVFERRFDTRYGITGRRITLRVPLGAPNEFVHQQLGQLQAWVQQQFEQRPELRDPFVLKRYSTGDLLQVGKRRYFLEVNLEDRGSHSAKLVGDTICLSLAQSSNDLHRNKSIKTLLSRVVAGDFYPEVSRRVLDINDRTVQRKIQNIFLKYNHSNWGSCSSHGNVNLSTRLLFAPDDVQDYVILHELAHLVELNHSDRFWDIVEGFVPDYQDKEKWLKVHRAKCDF